MDRQPVQIRWPFLSHPPLRHPPASALPVKMNELVREAPTDVGQACPPFLISTLNGLPESTVTWKNPKSCSSPELIRGP